jgi:ATP-dependent Lon protease
MNSFEELFSMQNFEEEGEFMPLISVEEEEEDNITEEYPVENMPILALKNTVLFPGNMIPIMVGRDKSIKAINHAYKNNRIIGVVSQKDTDIEDPSFDDIYHRGTIARIIKLIKMPDGSTTAILQGRKRFELFELIQEEPFMVGRVEVLRYENPNNNLEFEALISSIMDKGKQIIELSPNIPSEAIVMLKNISSKSFLLNFIASNLAVNVKKKQELLEVSELKDKAENIISMMDSELKLLELKNKIESKVRTDIEKQQRDYFLNQQLKTIQEELGQNPQEQEIAKLKKRAKSKNWPEPVNKAFNNQINKLSRINPQIAEYSIQLNYLELMLDLPWGDTTEDNFDLNRVKKVLDKEHHGLEKVKNRILEHLAVLKLKGDMKAPILCLVGPPGVGKTSLGKSIANAIGRSFIRMSLGGLHDESEVRGHRKTYIGAMPGRIIQSIKKAGSDNPVFILDEIDKVGANHRGDPSSALLEVLDPEQNSTFYDNYLELEYDLSKVMFIATANSLASIQPALRDRMEIIHVDGYSTEEKIDIAKKHLLPKQIKDHGIKKADLRLNNGPLNFLIENYTRESGVRNLNRRLGSVARYVAKNIAMEQDYNVRISNTDIEQILGPRIFNKDAYKAQKVSGVAVGLAWTQTGGDILFIESLLTPGKGALKLTGNLGNVMKESASTALTFLKANHKKFNIKKEAFDKNDIHIHVPEGAIPKDGPSAGVTMITALCSALSGRQVKPYLAMTGEITLRGRVLPVGGIKEKILAAKRSGIKEILLCEENKKHVDEIPQEYLKNMNFIYVKEMKDVIKHAIA